VTIQEKDTKYLYKIEAKEEESLKGWSSVEFGELFY
jgi:hypothetical protein